MKNQKLNRMVLLGLLTAITVVLSVFCTIRIGNAIKIPLKFISVFLAAAMFGPWCGGSVAALGDILNAVLVPVGTPLPLLTVLEFVSGFLFGIFFFKSKEKYLLRTFLCTLLLFLSDMLLTTWVLLTAGYFPTFAVAFGIRIWAGLLKWGLQFAVLLLFKRYLNPIQKLIQK